MDFKIKNFTMETFNNNVNNSGNIQTKYENWAEYRQQINRFISRSVTGTKSIIVLGAGECNDIDLHFLSDTFDQVTLSDVDAKSMDDGIARQKLNGEQIRKISKVQADYTGLSQASFFDELSKLAMGRAHHKDIEAYIINTIASIKTDSILGRHKNTYDAVWVCPTYTQLGYTQMEVLLKILYQYNIYPLVELNKILAIMHSQMATIIKNYNGLLLSLANENGRIFAVADMAEITDLSITESLTNNINDLKYINGFLADEGVDFAVIGREDLKSMIKIIDEEFAIWPFDDEKHYLVCLFAGYED